METGFATFTGSRGHGPIRPDGRIGDWFALRSRCAAAHAARRVLLDLEAAPVSPLGSFAPLAAQAIAELGGGFPAVNLTALADRKSPAGNETAVAAAQVPGGRGNE